MANGEGEFAHLRHRHPNLHRRARPASRQDRADGVGGDLPAHEHTDHHQSRHDVIVKGSVIDQHADGQEEQRAEHVPHRVDQPGHAAGRVGVADDHPDEECPGGRGQSKELGAQRQPEAAAQRSYQEGFVGLHPGEEAHQARGQQSPESQRGDAEDSQLGSQPSHVHQVGGAGGGDAGQ